MPRQKFYVGFVAKGRDVVFKSDITPTFETHGTVYSAVIGPFKTKRAAKFTAQYGRNNPHIQHVDDAERISARKELR